MSKLWHVDHQRGRGQSADPGNGHEASDALIKGATLLSDLRNHLIQGFDVRVDVIDPAAKLVLHKRVARCGETRLCGDLIFDHGPPSCQQLSEIMNIFAFNALWGQIKDHAHSCQHPGINAVGLGQTADSLSKAPRLLRIDLDERLPRQAEVSFKPTMICAGRLENDQHPLILTQPCA
ncbi:hypothetical protein NUTIK01_25200 [Novosphingobium sp. IK01]|uniref:Uncharacterized protein n=1 Tax=Novosphingobium pituita TaxID=3056842 RepID=A0ABQ6P8Z7_9SPHN|nr:hypothetical protein NUTIK01_25200 [Novosphingobium sp. IK01]